MNKICIVGAGFSGAVLGRELAGAGYECTIIDERSHVAGNCHTERDEQSGVMVHRYGPHIFHTQNEAVWLYISRFGTMMPYINRVKTTVGGKVYSMPINLHTINQFFGTCMSPAEAKKYIEHQSVKSIEHPQTFEEQALRFIGGDLYRAFFLGYTKKQWGLHPSKLPASILKRLPVRFNYDDNYFSHPHQGVPLDGYTKVVENILRHPSIKVRLGERFEDMTDKYDHVFYTGPLDRYFNYELGELGYRTLDFEEVRSVSDLQGCAVMNYGDEDVEWTRISQHNDFAPWDSAQHTGYIAFRERSRQAHRHSVPFYPIRLAAEKAMLRAYVDRAHETSNVTFMGRLGTYQYLDMDIIIARALETAERFIELRLHQQPIPTFFHSPLT